MIIAIVILFFIVILHRIQFANYVKAMNRNVANIVKGNKLIGELVDKQQKEIAALKEQLAK